MSRTAVSSGSGARGKTPHTRDVQPMRSCFGALLWVAAPAATCGTAAAPIPASTAFVNVRRFTEPVTNDLAVPTYADSAARQGQVFFLHPRLRIAQTDCA